MNVIPVAAVLLAAIAGLGALLSWRTFRVTPSGERHGAGGMPSHLLAGISILLAGLLCIDILLQGTASLIMNGCER